MRFPFSSFFSLAVIVNSWILLSWSKVCCLSLFLYRYRFLFFFAVPFFVESPISFFFTCFPFVNSKIKTVYSVTIILFKRKPWFFSLIAWLIGPSLCEKQPTMQITLSVSPPLIAELLSLPKRSFLLQNKASSRDNNILLSERKSLFCPCQGNNFNWHFKIFFCFVFQDSNLFIFAVRGAAGGKLHIIEVPNIINLLLEVPTFLYFCPSVGCLVSLSWFH